MTPFYTDDWLTLYGGDCREVLASLPADSVDCVVTSPPYWGLRDYGTATWDGGDPECDHAETYQHVSDKSTLYSPGESVPGSAAIKHGKKIGRQFEHTCGKCGATRIDSQLGLERTPEEYVANMVAVFREVRRVLKPSGTCWLNLGDSYASDAKGTGGMGKSTLGAASGGHGISAAGIDRSQERQQTKPIRVQHGLKPKDLVGIPWRVAFALQQPYYVGNIKNVQDRIWLAAMIDGEGCLFIHKRKVGQNNGQGYARKNDTYGSGMEIANTSEAIVRRCMEITGKGSIVRQEKDRRQPLYRWNLRSNECREVVREVYEHLVGKKHQARLLIGCPSSGPKAEAAHQALMGLHNGIPTDVDFPAPESMWEPGWYLRSDVVWAKSNPMPESVTDRPTKSHEMVFLLTKSPRYYFDSEAVREDVKPGTRLDVRVVPRKGGTTFDEDGSPSMVERQYDTIKGANIRSVWNIATRPYPGAHFAVFPPELPERCIKAGSPSGGVVLDCFGGSGTVGMVANRLSRRAILIDLNPEYLKQQMKRNAQAPLGLAG